MDSIYRFFKFLVRKRRVYIALSILVSLGIIYNLRQKKFIEANEYTCAIAFNNDFSNNNEKYITRDPKSYQGYIPYWQLENPFNFNSLYNAFQSTSFLNDAGNKINYRMRYTHKGIDIYNNRPFDLYVEYNNKYNNDNSFEAIVEKRNSGVILKNIKGFINDSTINISDEIFLAYDTPTDTPIGRLKISKRKENFPWEANYYVKVNFYNIDHMNIIFDKNMNRIIQRNIIICELKTDYTFDFVKNLFDSMISTYCEEVKNKYKENYNEYISKIDSTLKTLDKKDPLYERFNELKKLSTYDYQIINDKNIVTYIDKPYISQRNLIGAVGTFRYIIVFFVFIIIPIILLLIELFIRPININIEDLPENIRKKTIYHVDKSNITNIDKATILLLLQNRNNNNFFVSSVSHRCYQSDKFVSEINNDNINIKQCPNLDLNYNAIKETLANNGSLILLLNLGIMSSLKLNKINKILLESNIDFIVILFD